MATPAIQHRLVRTELVAPKQGSKDQTTAVHLGTDLKSEVSNCSMAPMTKAEAAVFFAVCENPSPKPIDMFANFSKVAQWFND